MKNRLPSPKPFLQLIAVLLITLSISTSTHKKTQECCVAILAPTWNQLAIIKQGLQRLGTESFVKGEGETLYVNEEVQKLHLENQLLKNKIAKLEEAFRQHRILDAPDSDENLQQGIAAQVIFRSCGAWNTVLWINVGKEHNQELGRQAICLNSPVTVGTAVVGVVDYVGRKQSRVRLLTDPSLNPSVRVSREVEGKTWLLAKGELSGSSLSKYRTKAGLLAGTGFNYDFSDQEGPARDLRSGAVLGERSQEFPALPIIVPDDLLITTGMDGIFPPGLSVARVKSVKMLKEGDYYYAIEAEPCCRDLDHLTLVSVLPSQGFDPSDQPPRY